MKYLDKPIEFWIALLTGALIVVERHKEAPLLRRIIIAAISSGIGYSLAPEAAELTGRSEVLAVMILTAFGFLAMDVATSLIADREFLKEMIRERFGKR